MGLTFVGGSIVAGSTSCKLPIPLGVSGETSATLTASYRREGAATVSISLSAASGPTDAFVAGKVCETNVTTGEYELHVPDAAFAGGASWVLLTVVASNAATYNVQWPLTPYSSIAFSGASWIPAWGDLIDAAFRKVGIIQENETCNSSQQAEAVFELQCLVNSLQNEGIGIQYKAWDTIDDSEVTTGGADGAYFTLTNIVALLSARFRYQSIDYGLEILSEGQWSAIPDKSSGSQPTAIFYSPKLGRGYLYPQPTDLTGYEIILSEIVAATSIDAESTPDFAIRANMMLLYCLAYELGINKGVPAGIIDRIGQRRDELKNAFRTTDTERKRAVRVPRFVS